MSINPRELALFVVDCSVTMGIPREFEERVGEHHWTHTTTPLETMLRYVKAKIAQRIMRDLRTTPVGVITYAVEKTKNILTTRLRERGNYNKAEDSYRHFFEEIPISFTPETGMIEHLSSVEAGKGPDARDSTSPCADLHTAIILAIETIDDQPKAAKYKKEIYLLTDGESKSDWDGEESTIRRLKEKGISLTVVGMDFDDEEVDFVEANKSAIKAENETHLNAIVDELEDSVVATAARATAAIIEPNVKTPSSVVTRTTLTLGSVEEFPDQALVIQIDVKKAVVPAAVKSMKKMSTRGFAPTSTTVQTERISQAFEASQRTNEPVSTGAFSAGRMGKSFEAVLADAGLAVNGTGLDLNSHDVVRETRYFYRPPDVPLDQPKSGGAQKLNDVDADNDEEEEHGGGLKPTGNVELTEAYYYGGSLVPTGDLEDGVGTITGNETGMQIIGFMKESDLRYDWRMNDVFYVYGGEAQTGSQMMLSAFVTALHERKSVAITRWVGKGMRLKGVLRLPDPKIGILFPVYEPPLEFFYWVQFPFSEDIRSFSFSSFTTLFNQKGERILEHRLLPTPAQDDAMDAFVDSMSLVLPDDDEGNPNSWFDVNESYSPAIHNIENTLVFRLSDPVGNLPPPPPVITRYLSPPIDVVLASEEPRKAAIAAFDVKLVPPKPKKVSKRVDNFAVDEDTTDFDRLLTNRAGPSSSSSTVPFSGPSNMLNKRFSPESVDVEVEAYTTRPAEMAPAPSSAPERYPMDIDDDPPTEDEQDPPTDDEQVPVPVKPAPDKVGLVHPVADFEEIVAARGTDEAVPLAFDAIEALVMTSFSTSKYDRAVQTLQAARLAAATKGVPKLYNDRLSLLVSKLSRDRGKRDFLAFVIQGGAGLLVGDDTTEKDSSTLLQTLAVV